MPETVNSLLVRLKEATEGRPAHEVGELVGADASYVRQWRKGEFPKTLGTDLRRRIERYLIGLRPGGDAIANSVLKLENVIREATEVRDILLATAARAAVSADRVSGSVDDADDIKQALVVHEELEGERSVSPVKNKRRGGGG